MVHCLVCLAQAGINRDNVVFGDNLYRPCKSCGGGGKKHCEFTVSQILDKINNAFLAISGIKKGRLEGSIYMPLQVKKYFVFLSGLQMGRKV